MSKGSASSSVFRSSRRRWVGSLLWFLGTLLVLVLLVAAGVGIWVFRYRQIVSAAPGGLKPKVEPGELGRWVNPFIGTGGYPWVCGHNFPGAMVPFGMVRLGPETVSLGFAKRGLNTSGYFYGDERILGFSHTRLNGTGATDGGHVLVTPGNRSLEPQEFRRGHSLRFSHHEEVASPGYYAVRLPEIGALTELTATTRVGMHRYTFDPGVTPHLVFDVMNALGGRRSDEGRVQVRSDLRELSGSVRTFGTFASRYGGIRVFFVARLSTPAASVVLWRDGKRQPGESVSEGLEVAAELAFPKATKPHEITLQVGLSYVSLENARANLEAEGEGRTFEQIAASARQEWEERLATIRVDGGTDTQRRIFYTALFRVFQMPTVVQDANGDYLGFDRQVHQAVGFRYFTDLSLWDTFRTVHPLFTLIAPQDQRDMVVSLIRMLEQGGWLPRWPSGNGYSNSMLGTPADIVVAETYLKGIRDFDIQKAYEAMRRTALEPTPTGSAFSGREGVEDILKFGYAPSDRMDESVARTLEFGWSDHALSLLAEALGRTNDAALFRSHSQFYRNLWNTNTQYFQPRTSAGTFVEPFDPLLLTYLDWDGRQTKDYVEGSPLQWRWAVPYDAPGLISLFRSREEFVTELDQFFALSHPGRGRWTPGPYYWHGNQPDLASAYLFNDAGRPDLTQKWVRWILEHKYGDGYEGLDGNDDGGTLSAWYVWSALGLYPVAGTDRYQLGVPLFPRAEIALGEGKLVVLIEPEGPTHSSVRRVWWNDEPLDRTWIRHEELARGGTLRFEVGPPLADEVGAER
ncbi:MAG: GH92 family glycosyl hydrolase [Verrucomicrobia bacterium]|nr:GH92 family glycosyl hydrolase [Verrucomicrobiota bacterium]